MDRTSSTFEHLLRSFQERLSIYGADASHIRYFVSDMPIPFANDVVKEFNLMSLPEYFYVVCSAAKTGNNTLACRALRTRLVWCSVHGDRAVSKHARESFKGRSSSLQQEMMLFSRNIRMAIVSAKRYVDLCQLVGFLDMFTSMSELCVVLPTSVGERKKSAYSEALLKRGEELLWKHIGGVSTET